jgi:hypothetical protein
LSQAQKEGSACFHVSQLLYKTNLFNAIKAPVTPVTSAPVPIVAPENPSVAIIESAFRVLSAHGSKLDEESACTHVAALASLRADVLTEKHTTVPDIADLVLAIAKEAVNVATVCVFVC